jgi:hypothetical protein
MWDKTCYGAIGNIFAVTHWELVKPFGNMMETTKRKKMGPS